MRYAPPLLLDAMLGRLARWLRMLGYDAAYIGAADDLDVVRMARAESRLIITRDRELAGRRGVEAVLLHSQQVEQQLAEVIEQVGSPQPPATPRCPICNVPLKELPRESARGRVPPYVWRTVRDFTACPRCHRVYWQGTHWDSFHQQIESIER